MFTSCYEKQEQMKRIFSECKTEEERYKKIIELGKAQPPFNPSYRLPENLVPGCQSLMYLNSRYENGAIYFEATSDALISLGLAAILIAVYSGETPESILKCPPDFLHDLDINASLSLNRANGLYSIHLKMKQEAVRLLVKHASQR